MLLAYAADKKVLPGALLGPDQPVLTSRLPAVRATAGVVLENATNWPFP
jgi:hypothetical protein